MMARKRQAPLSSTLPISKCQRQYENMLFSSWFIPMLSPFLSFDALLSLVKSTRTFASQLVHSSSAAARWSHLPLKRRILTTATDSKSMEPLWDVTPLLPRLLIWYPCLIDVHSLDIDDQDDLPDLSSIESQKSTFIALLEVARPKFNLVELSVHIDVFNMDEYAGVNFDLQCARLSWCLLDVCKCMDLLWNTVDSAHICYPVSFTINDVLQNEFVSDSYDSIDKLALLLCNLMRDKRIDRLACYDGTLSNSILSLSQSSSRSSSNQDQDHTLRQLILHTWPRNSSDSEQPGRDLRQLLSHGSDDTNAIGCDLSHLEQLEYVPNDCWLDSSSWYTSLPSLSSLTILICPLWDDSHLIVLCNELSSRLLCLHLSIYHNAQGSILRRPDANDSFLSPLGCMTGLLELKLCDDPGKSRSSHRRFWNEAQPGLARRAWSSLMHTLGTAYEEHDDNDELFSTGFGTPNPFRFLFSLRSLRFLSLEQIADTAFNALAELISVSNSSSGIHTERDLPSASRIVGWVNECTSSTVQSVDSCEQITTLTSSATLSLPHLAILKLKFFVDSALTYGRSEVKCGDGLTRLLRVALDPVATPFPKLRQFYLGCNFPDLRIIVPSDVRECCDRRFGCGSWLGESAEHYVDQSSMVR